MIAGGKSYFGAAYWGGAYWGGLNPNAAVYGEPVFKRRVHGANERPGVATARDVAQRIGGARVNDTAGGVGGAAGWTRRRIGKSIQ